MNCTSPRIGIGTRLWRDLLGLRASQVNDDRLYRALDRLLPHKGAVEQHLLCTFDLLGFFALLGEVPQDESANWMRWGANGTGGSH